MNNLSKLIMVGVMVAALSSCQTVKHAMGMDSADQQGGAQANGMGDQTSFNDENSAANRLKAPYDQTYHFEFDKYDVQQDDIASINAQANYLAGHPQAKIRIEGHADDRGSREYNIALGWRRAKAVAAVLQQQGVTMKQIAMVSFGKEKPVAFGHDEQAYSQNRRVELVYEAK
jgi:peptidoglycan-associated lipoprotein